jgi:hypothetical protein
MNFKQIGKGLILAVFMVTLLACGNDDETAPFEVIGDVYVNKKMMGDDMVYSKSYYAYANQPMLAAIVSSVSSADIDLMEIDNDPRTFGLNEEFTTNKPVGEAPYKFTVSHQDVPHETTDIMVFEDIDLPVISSVIVDNGTLEVNWEAGLNDEIHSVRLFNTSGDVVFVSSLLAKEVVTLVIDPASGSENWASGYPNAGDTYKLELHGILTEAGASNSDFLYNLQEIAIAQAEVVWE